MLATMLLGPDAAGLKSARYWRLLPNDVSWANGVAYSSYFQAIYEIRFYESSDASGVNVNVGATASALRECYPASNANDGATTVYWQSDGAATPNTAPWWQIDYGAGVAKTIKSVTLNLFSGGYHAKQYKLQCSADASIWDDVATFNTTMSATTQTFTGLQALPRTDPHWSNVSLLMTFNGANGGTTFTDLSSYAHTITRVGSSTALSTAQARNGTSSLLVTSNGGLNVPNHTSLDFGSGAWTVECDTYVISGTQQMEIIGRGQANNYQVCINAAGSGTMYCEPAGASSASTSAFGAAWRRVAWSCDGAGGKLRFYVDGVQLGNALNAPSEMHLNSGMIGNFGDSGSIANNLYLNGYMDNLRVTKGVSRYTGSSYTVDSGEFPTG